MNTDRELENYTIARYMDAESVESDNNPQEITLLFPHCPDSTLLFPQYKYTLKELRYHKSAEWLDRVIEKITSEPSLESSLGNRNPLFRFEVEVEKGGCSIFEHNSKGRELIVRQINKSTHKAIYEAIKDLIHIKDFLDERD